MLREYDRPPDFTLPDQTAGGQLSLVDLIGESRMIVAFVPDANAATHAQVLLDEAASRWRDLVRFDTDIMMIAAPDATGLTAPHHAERIHILTDATGETTKQYDCPRGGACVYMVGKGGRIRLASDSFLSLDELMEVVEDDDKRGLLREGATDNRNLI